MFVKRHNRNKNDLLVEEAELIDANSRYAHVMLNDGREIIVSLRDLVPTPKSLPGQNRNLNENNADVNFSPQHSEITHSRNE